MEYAKLKGITLYPHEESLTTHYTTIPWGEYEELERNTDLRNSHYFSERDIPRDDPNLDKVGETLKEDSNGFAANLSVVDIPDGVEWEVEEYDGMEWIAEKHRTWR